jgi:hypothetical protein
MGTDGPDFFDLPPAPLQGFAARDGHDFPWPIDEPVPGIAAVIEDVVEGFENSVRQPGRPMLR